MCAPASKNGRIVRSFMLLQDPVVWWSESRAIWFKLRLMCSRSRRAIIRVNHSRRQVSQTSAKPSLSYQSWKIKKNSKWLRGNKLIFTVQRSTKSTKGQVIRIFIFILSASHIRSSSPSTVVFASLGHPTLTTNTVDWFISAIKDNVSIYQNDDTLSSSQLGLRITHAHCPLFCRFLWQFQFFEQSLVVQIVFKPTEILTFILILNYPTCPYRIAISAPISLTHSLTHLLSSAKPSHHHHHQRHLSTTCWRWLPTAKCHICK